MGKMRIIKSGCKIDTSNSTLVCKPEIEEDGHLRKITEPAVYQIRGNKASIVNDGDVPMEVADRLKRYIEKNILRG